jgi:2-alkyl-3-oxoalkanoate reductase
LKIAIIGANGFVGSRLLESLHLGEKAEVLPIVRSVGSLARLARFDLDWRLADACNIPELATALQGGDTAVHTIVGDSRVIEAASAALLPAAAQAGVRRVVYLSTASVHGQNPAPGTSEESPLSDQQEIEYNNAKVRAERTLMRDAARYPVELIILRPSIVFGPRDRWISTLISELLSDTAWLINKGEGICNTIYVDNLVHAILLALNAPHTAIGRAYVVGDSEIVTWADLYRAVAKSAGIGFDRIHQIAEPTFPTPNIASRVSALRSSKAVQAVLPWIPAKLKRGTKGMLAEWSRKPEASAWQWPRPLRPSPTFEMVELQRCRVRFDHKRAATDLGYSARISFREGLERTVAWLKWSGRLE